MPLPNDNIGIVSQQRFVCPQSITLQSGGVLPHFELVYESYGTLNEDASNAVLVCHALTGDDHAAGFHHRDDKKPGWWDTIIGPGKPVDTNHFFVICPNNIGGCNGSTGPTSIDPNNNEIYGPNFPMVTTRDWVKTHAMLADYLGIEQFAAIIGGSLGGMQVLRWSIDYPERLRHGLVIAAAPKLSAQNIAFNEVARQSIMKDPDFHEGYYYRHKTKPQRGLALARMVGHLTYMAADSMAEKFGRQMRESSYQFGYDIEFEVESYLRYQGEAFSTRFDANCYMLMTKALDYFDPARDFEGDLAKTLSQAKCRFLVISFSSDWRFAPSRSMEIVKALIKAKKQVSYTMIEAAQGHDSFLLPIPRYLDVLTRYFDGVIEELNLAR